MVFEYLVSGSSGEQTNTTFALSSAVAGMFRSLGFEVMIARGANLDARSFSARAVLPVVMMRSELDRITRKKYRSISLLDELLLEPECPVGSIT